MSRDRFIGDGGLWIFLVVVALYTACVYWMLPVQAQFVGRASLTNASTDETLGVAFGTDTIASWKETAVYIDWPVSTTSGEVCVESATDAAYAGTWAVLSCVPFAGTAPKQDLIQITGLHLALRSRVNTVVVGGAGVNTRMAGN